MQKYILKYEIAARKPTDYRFIYANCANNSSRLSCHMRSSLAMIGKGHVYVFLRYLLST